MAGELIPGWIRVHDPETGRPQGFIREALLPRGERRWWAVSADGRTELLVRTQKQAIKVLRNG